MNLRIISLADISVETSLFHVNQKNKIYQMTKKNFNNKTIPWIADKA